MKLCFRPQSFLSSSEAQALSSTRKNNTKIQHFTRLSLTSMLSSCSETVTTWNSSLKAPGLELGKFSSLNANFLTSSLTLFTMTRSMMCSWSHWPSTMKRSSKATLSHLNSLVNKKLPNLYFESSRHTLYSKSTSEEFMSNFVTPSRLEITSMESERKIWNCQSKDNKQSSL